MAGPGQLPPVALPKVPNKAQAVPSFKTQIDIQPTVIRQTDRGVANLDITTYRSGQTTPQVVQDFAAASPELSGTLNAYLRIGIPKFYTVIARDMDGTINVESTKAVQEILRRLTMLGDPTLGYNPTTDLQSLSESLAKELVLYGGMGLELSLDKQRLPLNLLPVSIRKLKWKEEQGGVYPIQEIGGQEISLDIPTFFYASVDQDLLTPYASSMLESAIQATLADAQFLNDLRRSMQKVIQPRLVATIVEEKLRKSMPPDVATDSKKLTEYLNNIRTQIENQLTGLTADQALVGFDLVEYEMLNPSGSNGSNVADVLKTVQSILESKISAGTKTLPAVLGRADNGTSASTSTMVFLKNADVIPRKLNVLYSRALTMAARLLGHDVFVEFEYGDLDIRPAGEQEAYKAMRQSRILEQLSLGFISDEEASIKLTGNLPRDGFSPLAGTMFAGKSAVSDNPDSQTSNMNKGGAPDKLKSNAPAAPKSGTK